jgi:hypothetical protein
LDGTYLNGNMQQYFSMSGGKTFGLDPKINGYQNLTFGPFYPELDSLRIEYSGTNWTSSDCNLLWRYRDVAKEGCVQCYTEDWSGPPLDCSITTNSTTLLSRNTTMLCGVLLGKPQITPTVAPTATPTVTPSATISEPAIMPRKLTTNFPLIYTTSVPSPNNSSTNDIHRVVPFNIQLWESCGFKGGDHVVTLVYTNGPNETQYLELLRPGGVLNVDMKIPGYNPLKFGPFDRDSGMLKVEYEGSQYSDAQCEADDQAEKIVDTCVYCNHGKWDGEPIDCNKIGHWRYKKMFCQAFLDATKII